MSLASPAFSRLGLGITGPHAGLAVAKSATRTLIRDAIGLGVTYFDTGPAYGNGEAERRLGAGLKGVRRERVFVSTKAGIHTGNRRDFSPGAVEMSLKASLDRLDLKHVDLLLLHGPARAEIDDRLMRRLKALRDRGLFTHLGICGRGEEIEATLDHAGIDAVMAPVNANLSADDRDRLERIKAAGKTVIGVEIMAGTRRRGGLPTSPGDLWYALREAKQSLTGTSRPRSALSPTEALEWALAQPVCDAALCLTTRRANLGANAAAAGLEAVDKIP